MCASGLAISIGESGTLQSATSNITYNNRAGIYGLAVIPNNDFVYSADDPGNAVWVHSFNSITGIAEEVQYLSAANGSDPRHLAVHPNGKWVCVVYDAASSIAVYSRDTTTELLTYTNTAYSLLPSGFSNATIAYLADEVLLSEPAPTPIHLFISSQQRDHLCLPRQATYLRSH